MATLTEITDGNFSEKVLKSSVPALVVFSASWSGPCRQMMPLVEELAGEYSGRAFFGKMDADASQATCVTYGVRSLPAILIFKSGLEVDRIVGAVAKSKINEKLQKYA